MEGIQAAESPAKERPMRENSMGEKQRHINQTNIIALCCAIGLAVLMLVLSIFSLVSYQTGLAQALGDMRKRDLERDTGQSILLFHNMVIDCFDRLDTVAQICSIKPEPYDPEVQKLILRNNGQENSYMRLGISDAGGKLYIGENKPVDISKQDYFRRAIKGERVFSSILNSSYNGASAIVFAIPVEIDGVVKGVACAQYNTRKFSDLLGNSQFKGIGATMVMQKDGKMLSDFAGMENFDTFYDALEPMEFRDGDTPKTFYESVQQDESGFLTYYNNNKARYLCYQPTGIGDYVMLSLVAAESMDRDASSISWQALLLTVKNVLFYCVILISIWVISVLVRRLILSYQKDPLTLIYNKISAKGAIERFLRGLGGHGTHVCLFLDIDNFKEINDRFGHAKGDSLLVTYGRVLKENFRMGDIISRFGGDEFMVFMKNISNPQTAEKKARLLCEALRNVDGVCVSVSIGIACYPKDGSTYDELVRNADEALYQAKNKGKNQYQLFQKKRTLEAARREPACESPNRE